MKRLNLLVIFLVTVYFVIRIVLIELRVILIEARQKRMARVAKRLIKRRDTIEAKWDRWLDK